MRWPKPGLRSAECDLHQWSDRGRRGRHRRHHGWWEAKSAPDLVAATEHKAILEAAHRSATSRQGSVETIPVDGRGHVDIDWLKASLGPDVAVVAIMLANNETGTLFAPSEAADLVHGCGALLLCDATQAGGKVPIELEAWHVDLALLSAHKMYGPKGVGALVANRAIQRDLVPIVAGGGQEFGLRGAR